MKREDVQLFVSDFIRHNTRETLIAICEKMHLAYKDRGAKSMEIAGRRFFFGANGDIVKILDYETDTAADENGKRVARLPVAKKEHLL